MDEKDREIARLRAVIRNQRKECNAHFKIGIEQIGEKRVIKFGGLLSGKPDAWEGTEEWHDGFIIAEILELEIQPLNGFSGDMSERKKK